jgi:transposase
MTRYTQEIKLQVAKRYLNELISYRELANQVEVDESVLRYWVMLVRHHGDQAFTFPYTNYPSAFKLRVIQFITEKNCSIREASAIFHIPDPCMVRRWVEKWERAGEDAFGSSEMRPSTMTANHKNKKIKDNSSNQTMEDMKKELEYLRMENAYLKKLNTLVQEEPSPTKSKRK